MLKRGEIEVERLRRLKEVLLLMLMMVLLLLLWWWLKLKWLKWWCWCSDGGLSGVEVLMMEMS